MKTSILACSLLFTSTLAWGNCVYEGKEFPERSTLKMINNIKECRTGRWEKIKISKEEEVCNLQDSYYPENTIVKTANDFRICKHKRTGYEWEVAHLNDATPKPETK